MARVGSSPERDAGQAPVRRGRTVDGPEHWDAMAMAAEADSCRGCCPVVSEASELWDAINGPTTDAIGRSAALAGAAAGLDSGEATSGCAGSPVAWRITSQAGGWLGREGLSAGSLRRAAASAPRLAVAARSGIGLNNSEASWAQSRPPFSACPRAPGAGELALGDAGKSPSEASVPALGRVSPQRVRSGACAPVRSSPARADGLGAGGGMNDTSALASACRFKPRG